MSPQCRLICPQSAAAGSLLLEACGTSLYLAASLSRGASTHANHIDSNYSPVRRRSSSLADIRNVQDLTYRNIELADAIAKDREMARIRLYERIMPKVATSVQGRSGFMRPRSAIQESQLESLVEADIRSLLRPCVSRDELLQGDVATLRQRLAAVLHFTGLHEQYPVDLQDKGSMDAIAEEFASASQTDMVLSYKNDSEAEPPKSSSWRPPVSLIEARRRSRMNCSQQDEHRTSVVPVRDFANLLVDAGFEDVVSVDVSKLSDQRDFDVLLLATGRSPQHAFAGAKAIKYLLKQAYKAQGAPRHVQIAHDSAAAWYSVPSGPVSVHCMSREIREQLDLESLWGQGADLTWFQKGPSVLTLDTITADSPGDDDSGDEQGESSLDESMQATEAVNAMEKESR